jgi:hypothetical protein
LRAQLGDKVLSLRVAIEGLKEEIPENSATKTVTMSS